MHPMRMAKRIRQHIRPTVAEKKTGDLRWRPNQIVTWREKASLTQQEVVDRLALVGIKRDRNTISRIEGGYQNIGIAELEAIAKIVRAPSVTAMTDHTPDQWDKIQRFLSMNETEQERVLRIAAAVSE